MTELTQQLKVLHIISGDLWAGAEVQACTLLSHLRDGVQLSVVLLNHGELELRLRDLGIEVVVLDESRLNSLLILLSLIKHTRRFNPDIVHTHRQKENILGAIATLFSRRTVSLRTVHGAPEFEAEGIRRLIVGLDIFLGRHMQKAVIAVSSELAAKLSANFEDRAIVTIVNGVDEQAICGGLELPAFKLARPEAVHIGIVGRLEAVKRVDIFIHMAALLIERNSEVDWQFHVLGDGALLGDLETLAGSLGLGERLVFHRHRQDIHNYIAALDMLVMCSDHEGLPMTALESLALGTPLLAHKVGGLIEVLSQRPEQLIEDHSVEGYYQGLMELMGRTTTANSLAEKFRATSNARSVHALYRELAKNQ